MIKLGVSSGVEPLEEASSRLVANGATCARSRGDTIGD